MKRNKLSKQTLAGFSALSRALLIVVFLSIILFSLQGIVYAQSEKGKNYTTTLKSRTFTPQPGIKPLLRDNLIIQLERGEKRHVYLQLKTHLNEKERVKLSQQGVKLLNYIGFYTWYATVFDRQVLVFIEPEAVERTPILGKIRWIGAIDPADRVATELLRPEIAKLIRTEDNRERYTVYFFKDVPIETGRKILLKHGARIEGETALTRAFFVVVPLGVRDKLIAEDAVKLIDLYPPLDILDNNGSRAWCHTDGVHIAGITGARAILGQWEAASGLPRNQHVDLTAGRVHWEDAEGAVHYHATHVAGTMIGTGAANAARMGHAPDVTDIHCYTSGGAPGEMAVAISDHGIVAANNSWGKTVGWSKSGGVWQFEPVYGQSYFGDYRWDAPAFDELVRDSGLVIVFSAGNDRDDPTDGSETNAQPGDWDQIVGAESWDGYHTVRPYATGKNVITVGAINDATSAMADYSNWGPTDDGRIKPDLVAPGESIWSTNNVDSNGNGTFDDYRKMGGTSVSAPAVTGIVALLIQSYREEYLGVPDSTLNPLPSTIKALLIQSADDMGNRGPDYRFGWGGVRADAARQLILDKKFLEGVVLETGDYDVYEFTTTGGEPELKITLAWDDHQAGAGNPNPAIINDLDLVVEDPDGNFYTPWHLHVTDHADIGDVAEREKHTVASVDVIPEAARDRWNNVEQVLIDAALVGGPLPGGRWRVYVNAYALPEPPQSYSLIVNEYRLQGQVDIMQVLDRSGSMWGHASDASMDRKIEVLRYAADQFIQMMKPDVGNQLGLVQFNQDVVPFDPAHDANLSELTSARATLLRETTVPFVEHGGSTSIGDGLQEALNQLTNPPADPDHDHVILLVSDGKENTASWIAGVQDDIIANNIAVYPLGLGYGSGINEAKLTDLAEATGGTYRITSDDLIFRKFFIEVLVGAVDWDVIVDPVGELNPGDTVYIPVTITSDQFVATFTAYWDGTDDAVKLELIPPSGEELAIKLTTDANGIRYGDHQRYAFYQLDFPLGGDLAGELAGEWKMKLTAASSISQNVRYSASAFGEGGAELDVTFDRLSHLTGDKVLMTARLTRRGTPLTGATVEVDCDKPIVGAGNVLREGKVSRDELEKDRIIFGDTINLIDRKLQILSERAGVDILKRGTTTLQLCDDGQHSDGDANDGLYANKFSETKLAGSFTCRFVASDIPAAGGQTTTREWTKSFYNEVNIDPEYSVIDVRMLSITEDGRRYSLKIVPRDQFVNYLGPGHPVSVTIAYTDGSRQVTLDDNIDGTYTKEIFITQNEIKAGAKLEVDVDGKRFTTVEQLSTYGKCSVSIHSGAAIPTGSFNNNYNADYSFGLDFDYHLTPQFSVLGLLGYNHFNSGSSSVSDTYWWNISANLKYEFTTNPLRPYINGGPGIYIPEHGSTELGFNAGLGLDYSLTSDWIVELGADYHHVFTSGSDTQFFVPHLGLIFRF